MGNNSPGPEIRDLVINIRMSAHKARGYPIQKPSTETHLSYNYCIGGNLHIE
jgi:hypothetical protein